jgi:hypothetical protein
VNHLQIDQNKQSSQLVNGIKNPLIAQNLIAQIPWGHIEVIIIKIKNIEEAIFRIQKTKEINLSRVLFTIR